MTARSLAQIVAVRGPWPAHPRAGGGDRLPDRGRHRSCANAVGDHTVELFKLTVRRRSRGNEVADAAS
ncbi:hypothetical protein [Streptomyces acidicola]|uniref:Uncharacterized protein n=1 Tax=Streptomyces acidicola TaxID=2596892 RepID=A0A5N8X1X2_9ACTN|nr:hypothetical protein [Streptomyces acidicola]MPY52838.1 hypothetical protein [Streptomyces acidicola]